MAPGPKTKIINVCAAPDCGKQIPPAKGTRARLYCDSTCRSRASRLKIAPSAPASRPTGPRLGRGEDPDPGAPTEGVTLVAVTLASLTRAGRVETVAGQAALAIARRIESPGTTGSAVGTLARELRAVMAEAMAGVASAEPDEIDELEARRRAKVASA